MTVTNETRIEAVEKSIKEMIDLVKGLDEDTIRWNPVPEEWSIMQIAVHVAEAIPFWLGEIQRINKDATKQWGRGLTHEGRLHAVSEENISRVTVDDVLVDLEKIPSQVSEVVLPLTDKQLATIAPAKNPNFDGKPVQFIVDNLIVKHIEGHVGQMKRNLSKL